MVQFIELVGCRKCPPWVQGGHFAESLGLLFVESRVGEIHVFLVHLLLGQFDSLTEISDLSKSPVAQCLQGFWGFFSGLKNVRTSPYFWLFVPHHAAISPINSNGSGLL